MDRVTVPPLSWLKVFMLPSSSIPWSTQFQPFGLILCGSLCPLTDTKTFAWIFLKLAWFRELISAAACSFQSGSFRKASWRRRKLLCKSIALSIWFV